MGKVKTVMIGDEVAEEKARKKVAVKREQKKVAKKEESHSELVSESLANASSDSGEMLKQVQHDKKKVVEASSRGQKYLKMKSLVDKSKVYSISEAVKLVKETSYSSFDGTVEVHLNVADKGLRGIVSLPHGTGKEVRVKIADDALIDAIVAGGKIDFDILVAEPSMMPKLARAAKILGPKGLMPNPKTGTIGPDPKKLAEDLAKGQLQWKTEPSFPIVHSILGKVSFDDKKIVENFNALIKSIGKDKIRSVFIKATMGPSVEVGI